MDSGNKDVEISPISDTEKEKPISLVSKPSLSQKSSSTAGAGTNAAKSARSKSLASAKSSEK